MKSEVKEDVPWMPLPSELPSLAKKSAQSRIPTDRVLASVQEAYARIENHRAKSAQKETEIMANQTEYLDSLAEKVLRALKKEGMDEYWCETKADALMGKSRLEVLDWIACSLDGDNKNIVADMLKIDVQHIQSLQLVLQKTRWV